MTKLSELILGLVHQDARCQVSHGPMYEERQRIAEEIDETFTNLLERENSMTIEKQLEEISGKLTALINVMTNNPGNAAASAAPKQPAAPKQLAAEKVGLTYDDVKTPFLDYVKRTNREAGVALLKKFNAEKLPDVKPADWQKVLDAIKAASEANSTSALA